MVVKQIRGDSFQCLEGWGAAARKVLPNKKERLFCKRPHHPMLTEENGLFPISRPTLLLAAHRCCALHSIEKRGGRMVSEVDER